MAEQTGNFEKIRIDRLIPDGNNARVALKPGDEEYDRLKNSITSFGFVDPIVYETGTGLVIGGHQRLQVLKDEGVTELLTMSLGAISWAFPSATIPEMDRSKMKALNIALNKVVGLWDFDILKDVFTNDLLGGEIISLTGFEQEEVDQLLAPITEVKKVVDFTAIQPVMNCPWCGKPVEKKTGKKVE